MQVWDVREWRHAVQHIRPQKESIRSEWVKNVSHVREWMSSIQNSKEKEKK